MKDVYKYYITQSMEIVYGKYNEWNYTVKLIKDQNLK